MATNVTEKEDQKYDRTQKPDGSHDDLKMSPEDRQAEIDGLERDFAAPATSDGSGLSADEIASAENGGREPAAGSSAANDFGYRDEGPQAQSGLQRLRGRLNNKQLLAGGAGVGVLLVGIMVVLMILSSLKVVHFSEILTTTGYARFNGIMEERMTQDIFDASLVEGDGSVSIQGRSLVDRIKLRNVDNQISELGRDGTLKFIKGANDDTMAGVRVNGKAITLDDIAKQSGFGDDFASLKLRQKMTVRKLFVDEVKSSVGDATAEDARFIRGRIFATIADDLGFSFSRFAQAGRSLLGKTPAQAQEEDTAKSSEYTTQGTDVEGLSGDVQKTVRSFKSEDKLKAYLEKTGGTYDPEAFAQAAAKDVQNAVKVQTAATAVSKGVLLASLACMANEAFSHVSDIQKNNEKEASRQGLQLVAGGSQTKAGAVTSIAEQTAAKQLDGNGTIAGAEASPYYQYQSGQQVSTANQDIPRVIPKTAGSTFVKLVSEVTKPTTWLPGGVLLSHIPGGGKVADSINSKFCGAILSPAGAVAVGVSDIALSAVVGFFSEGSGAAAEQGGEQLGAQLFVQELGDTFLQFGKALTSSEGLTSTGKTLVGFTLYALGLRYVATALAGTSFFGAEQGSNYYTNSAIGTNILQSRQLRSMHGRPMPSADASQVDKKYVASARDYYQNQSVFARYFSTKNPFSMIGMASAEVPSSFDSGLGTLRTFFGSIGQILQPTNILKSIASIISPATVKAYADNGFDPYDGLTQWGFTPDEIYKMENDPTYNIYNNPNYISQQQIQNYDQQYGKCFDPARSQTDVDNDKNCKASNPIWNNPLFFRYRLYKLDGNIADMAQDDLSGKGSGSSTSSTSGNKNIYMIGDSLSVGMSPYLPQALTGQGFNLVDNPIQATQGINVGNSIPNLQADSDKVKSAGTIVIELGTNNCALGVTPPTCMSTADFERQITLMMSAVRAINPTAKVYWVNTFTTRSAVYQQINQAISNQASSQNYSVIDWAQEVASHPTEYSFDASLGVHQTTAQGYSSMANFISGAVK